MCNKAKYMYMNTRQRTKAEGPEGVESGEGLCSLPPRKIFYDLIWKWHILMHISGILTYLFCSVVPAGTRVWGGKFLIIKSWNGAFWCTSPIFWRIDLLILKFCCMCNKAEYMYMNTRQRTKAEGAYIGGGVRGGAVRPCVPSLSRKFLMI